MPRNFTRRALVAGSSAGAVAGLTGIAGITAARRAPAVIRQAGSDVEIGFWYGFGGANGERVQALVDGFNTLGTGVTVNALQQSTYEETAQQLTISLQDGTAPDVAVLSDVWWFRFYLAGTLRPLDDLVAASPAYAFDDLLASIREEGRRAGQLYWLPFARSTPIVYYNRQMLADAGLGAFPATWSEFEAAAPSLADPDAQVAALSLPISPTIYGYTAQGIVWAFGGAYSDPDLTVRLAEPGAVAAGAMLQRGIEAGWAVGSETYADDVASGFAFASMASTGGLTGLQETAAANGIDLGTAMLPGEPAADGISCPSGGSGLSVIASGDAEREQAAFRFIEYVSAYEQTVPWAQQTGYLPIRTSAIESPEMAEFLAANPNYAVAVEQFPRTKPQDAARTLVPNGDQIIGNGFGDIVINGTDAQEAFDRAAADLEAEAAPVRDQIAELEGGAAARSTRRR